MNQKVYYVTKEGLEKLKEELDHRKGILRREIADRIDQAKELGDLSENAEYAEAKDEQAFNEGRVFELIDMIQNASLIEETKGNGKVQVGSTIRVQVNGKEKEYTITGASEADPAVGRISNESPLGSGFLGHKKGDVVQITVPSGKMEYTIISVK